MKSFVEFPSLGIRLNIERVAFYVGDKPVYWYGIIIAIGLLLGVMTVLPLAKKKNISSDTIYDIVLWGLPSAVVCARVYYVAFEFDSYKHNLADIFKIWNGGIAIYGALIGAALAAYIYCRAKKINFLKIADVCCPGLVVGQIIGRWGNFVNQEAFGTNTTLPWGMTGSDIVSSLEHMRSLGMSVTPDMPVHPTFLYESLWNLCVLGILLFMFFKMHRFNGQLFLSYITLYGIGRFFVEMLRTDSLYIGVFRVSQLVALACVAIGVAFLIVGYKKQKKDMLCNE